MNGSIRCTLIGTRVVCIIQKNNSTVFVLENGFGAFYDVEIKSTDSLVSFYGMDDDLGGGDEDW